jgi:hypothetical protein
MKRSVLASVFLAATAAFVVAGPLHGQRSTTRGFNLGLHLGGASLKIEDGDSRDDGAGAGIHLGYGINRTITLLLQLDGHGFMLDDGTIQGEWTLGQADLGARFHFASTLRRWVPYLEASLTGMGVTVKDPVVEGQSESDITFGGGGFSGGGGILFYLKENLALEGQVKVSGGEFTEIEVDNVTVSGLEIDAGTSRVSLGLSWWP